MYVEPTFIHQEVQVQRPPGTHLTHLVVGQHIDKVLKPPIVTGSHIVVVAGSYIFREGMIPPELSMK